MDTASHAPGQNLLGGDAQTLRPNSVRPVSLAHLREHLQGLGAQVSSQLVILLRLPVLAWTPEVFARRTCTWLCPVRRCTVRSLLRPR